MVNINVELDMNLYLKLKKHKLEMEDEHTKKYTWEDYFKILHGMVKG